MMQFDNTLDVQKDCYEDQRVGNRHYRRNRYKYSSRDLRVFRYSFSVDFEVLSKLKLLGIMRVKIKRRGTSAGVKKRQHRLRVLGQYERINRLIGERNSYRDNKKKANVNNLILIERPFIKFSYPSIVFANCRSLRNKIDEISVMLNLKDPDIAIFVETWLTISDVDAFDIDGYRSIHGIRNRPDKDHGGGVSLYIKNGISIISVKHPECSDIEIVSVLFRSANMQREIPFIAIVAVYSSPANVFSVNTIEYILTEIDRIRSINADADVMIIGDFNDLDIDKKLREPYYSQLIKQQTCNSKLVDKCFYSGKVNYIVKVSAPVASSDHKLVELTPVNYIKKSENNLSFVSRPRRNSGYRSMGNFLSNVRWDDYLADDNLDTATETFHSLVARSYEEYFPLVISNKKKNSKQWFNWQIQKAILLRNEHYQRNETDLYNIINKKVKELIFAAKKKQYDKLAKLMDSNSLNFYDVVDSYSKSSGKFQDVVFPGMEESDSIDWTESFYKGILNKHLPIDNEELPAYLPGLEIKPISEAYVYSQLRKVKANVSIAPDGIPNFVLREYALELSYPVTILLNRSLSSGMCPEIWKKNFLITIPKKKIVESPSDLRPIVLSSSIVKIMERHISNELLSVISDKIDRRQFGGLPGKSAEHYLTFYMDSVYKSLDKSGNRVTAIITDYSKAFDAVDHNLFMRKLVQLDAPPMICKWISSFLEGRLLIMKWNNNITNRKIWCANGAPQGSVLGGIIFSITINEVASSWESRLKYVDDLTVLCAQPDSEDGHLPQLIMESLYRESVETKMALNVNKCQYMVHCFTRNQSVFELKIGMDVLSKVDECKIIGVIVQSNLKWDSHIESVIAKTNRKMFLLYRLRNVGMSVSLLTKAYLTYLRPCMEYCCVVWTNSITKVQVADLERVQKRVTRIILGNNYVSYEMALSGLGICTLEERRNSLFKKYAVKFLSAYPEYRPVTRLEHSGRNTRAASKLCVPRCKTRRYMNSPIPKMIEVVNSLI